MGVLFTGIIGWVVHKEQLDAPALIGMALIVAGAAVIRLFSNTGAHG